MSIRKADPSDFDAVKFITRTAISEIYPRYYPKGAVEFFISHHSDSGILNDIKSNQVFLCLNANENAVGTVTLNKNEICRLFVLPEFQGKGHGRELLDFAEKTVFEDYSEVTLAASFPAKPIYLKRGYKELGFNTIKTDNNDFLCYDVMTKKS